MEKKNLTTKLGAVALAASVLTGCASQPNCYEGRTYQTQKKDGFFKKIGRGIVNTGTRVSDYMNSPNPNYVNQK
jgi:hypothetical protein